ncbi:MAG: leucyl/phenylalanyl-tRNA--protein transferase [Pseudomonadota bacterium]|nr:leucyl/phenylalanyl-tRNA--protein transferase [Desulfobacterales bacterium]MBU0699336.1 leucyl/phenylalanyl-tRNA--protein transferase [Pseudomonadota bacterium]
MPVFLLSENISFPPPHFASKEGLLAVGGDLSQQRLLLAYRMGIFPWFSDDEPILWWSPHPRLVLYPEEIRVSKTLKKIIRKNTFHITMDSAFEQVIQSCAKIRIEKNEGTWIVQKMIDAYCKLHGSGFAHSVEAWYQGELAGGIYGISLGKCFFGESMFSRISNASNVTLVKLVEYLKALSFDMLDCQITTAHLLRFGAREIPRAVFLKQLKKSLTAPTLQGRWSY